MKSYHANSGAGLAGLTLKEHDEPAPGAREVLIRVRANSLNFRELSVLRGSYPLPVKRDVVMGADGAGEIVEDKQDRTLKFRSGGAWNELVVEQVRRGLFAVVTF
jgi:NADPH:quinone reductase-like Zn-dependent oxidoreductase